MRRCCMSTMSRPRGFVHMLSSSHALTVCGMPRVPMWLTSTCPCPCSAVIMALLEEAFPSNKPLMPPKGK